MDKPLWIVRCSPVYKRIFDRHFMASLKQTGMFGRVELVVYELPENFPHFMQRGSLEADANSIDDLLRLIKCHKGRHIITSGVDFHFYRDIIPELQLWAADYGIQTSMDSPTVHCADFQSFVAGQKPFQFYERWLRLHHEGQWNHSQESFNAAFVPEFVAEKLPREFWTIGLENLPMCPWEPPQVIPYPPQDIALHHANFTLFKNKELLLDIIASRVAESQTQPTNGL